MINQATLAKTSATLTLRADQAGTMLPASAVNAPMPGPQYKAGRWNKKRSEKSRVGI